MAWLGLQVNIASITQVGFDIARSSKYGALGRGIYFARDSRYSDDYARPCQLCPSAAAAQPAWVPGCKAILLCQVVLGRVGTYSWLSGSGSNTHHRHNHDSSIFAVFDNASCYPAYIIHYRKVAGRGG